MKLGMWMGMWMFMLMCNLLEPGILIYCGRKLIKDPPRSERSYVSYNTSRARKSREAWEFAQKFCGRVWWDAGIAMAALATLIQIMLLFSPTVGTAIWVWFGVFIAEVITGAASLIVVEVNLRRNFDENGYRR